MNRRELLRGASALGLGIVLAPAGAWAQKKTVKLAFIGPLTGGTASNGLGGRNSFLLAVRLDLLCGLDDAALSCSGGEGVLPIVFIMAKMARTGGYSYRRLL